MWHGVEQIFRQLGESYVGPFGQQRLLDVHPERPEEVGLIRQQPLVRPVRVRVLAEDHGRGLK